MHHKRKRPKFRRAGCLFCKPYKRNGTPHWQRPKFSDLRREVHAREAAQHPPLRGTTTEHP